MAFPLSNEPEVEKNQEENEMDNGANAADFRRKDKARAQERYRNASEVQIEKNPSIHKESTREKLAYVLPWSSGERVRLPSSQACALRLGP
jgi:hypothetical protein